MRWTPLFFGLLFAGSATAQMQPNHMLDCQTMKPALLLDEDDLLAFPHHGFSVKPPSGFAWCLAFRNPELAFIYGDTRGPSQISALSADERLHTLFLTVAVKPTAGRKIANAADLRAFAESVTASGGRFIVVRRELDSHPAPDIECVRVRVVVEEHDNPRAGGKTLILENRPQLLCRHPTIDTSVIELAASERYVKGAPVQSLLLDVRRKDIDDFMSSLKFLSGRSNK